MLKGKPARPSSDHEYYSITVTMDINDDNRGLCRSLKWEIFGTERLNGVAQWNQPGQDWQIDSPKSSPDFEAQSKRSRYSFGARVGINDEFGRVEAFPLAAFWLSTLNPPLALVGYRATTAAHAKSLVTFSNNVCTEGEGGWQRHDNSTGLHYKALSRLCEIG